MGFGVGLDPVGVVWGARDLDPGWFLDLGVVWGARDLDPAWFLDLFITSALLLGIELGEVGAVGERGEFVPLGFYTRRDA